MTNAPSTPPSGRPRPAAIAVRYLVFAVIAGAMNLGIQAIAFPLLSVWPLELSILAGTGVGFAVKFLLDKHWIFFDGYHGPTHEARKIFLYGSFSVAMTLIFWGFEVGFFAAFGSNTAKYTGGAIGLAIGNFLKYWLDRTYTFGQKPGAINATAGVGGAPGETPRTQKARSWS
ncbi:MAG: GtrA family protein [Methylocella sp.]